MKVLSGSLAYLSLTSAEQARDESVCANSHLKSQPFQVIVKD